MLSDPRVQQVMNRYFVPCLYSFDESPDKTDQELFDGVRAARQANRARHPGEFVQGPEGTIVVLTPKGEFVGESNVVTYVNEPLHLVSDLERFAAQLGVKPGEAPAHFRSHPDSPPHPDDLVMRVTSRFLFRRDYNRRDVKVAGVEASDPLLPVDYTFRPARRGNRNHVPAQDWVVLAPPQWQLLVPEDKMYVGAAYDIDSALAASLLMHFSAPVFSGPLSPDRVREHAMRAFVAAAKGTVLTIQVKGSMLMPHRWMASQVGGERQRVRAEVVGYIEYDTSSRRIRDVRLVTTDATYHGAPPPYVKEFPFGAAMYTLNGDAPTWVGQTASR